jgi:DNA helicase-2/ATP-dependent DNA helicase PcrA
MAWDKDLDKNGVAYKIAAAAGDRIRVIAGPGTGKSYAMKRRVARLLEEKVKPKKMLAVTFTRVAAEDLHRELQKLDVPGCDELEGQTLHSLAMRILSRQHVLKAMGRTPRPLNDFEQKAMYCDIAPHHGGKKITRRLVQDYEGAWAQSQGDQPGFPKTPEEKAFQADLLSWHGFHQSMLIGEVIPYLVRYLKENPAADEHGEFEHVLADEYQDLNKAEQTAIAYLSEKAHICIVGDDDQSIYSFKNAHPEGIREWKTIHAGCADFEMAECQRCPTDVVAMANSLIDHNKQRAKRELKPIDAKGKGEVQIVQLINSEIEAKWIAKKTKELTDKGVLPSEIIVLVQRKKGAPIIVNALKEAGVPAKSYYEESQLETEDAQMHFAVFKLFFNKDDRVALRYLIGLNSNNFHATGYAKIRAHCESSGDSPFEALEKLAAGALKFPHTKPIIEQFVKLKTALDDLEPFRDNVPGLVDELFPDGQASVADLRELALLVMPDAKDAKELFSAMMKEITQPDIPPEVKEVRVMSLNKSKGLSSPYVFIAQCLHGVLPKIQKAGTPQAMIDGKLEESRRLFFVGITRVKAGNGHAGSLFLTYPREMGANAAKGRSIPFSKTVNGRAQLTPSMFIQELGPKAPAPVAGTA